MIPRTSRRGLTAALVAGLLLAAPARTDAHEIPARVTVLAFVRPEGRTLRVVVRVPSRQCGTSVPLRELGYLDLARAGRCSTSAAMLWISGSVELQENGRSLLTSGSRRPGYRYPPIGPSIPGRTPSPM